MWGDTLHKYPILHSPITHEFCWCFLPELLWLWVTNGNFQISLFLLHLFVVSLLYGRLCYLSVYFSVDLRIPILFSGTWFVTITKSFDTILSQIMPVGTSCVCLTCFHHSLCISIIAGITFSRLILWFSCPSSRISSLIQGALVGFSECVLIAIGVSLFPDTLTLQS